MSVISWQCCCSSWISV